MLLFALFKPFICIIDLLFHPVNTFIINGPPFDMSDLSGYSNNPTNLNMNPRH